MSTTSRCSEHDFDLHSRDGNGTETGQNTGRIAVAGFQNRQRKKKRLSADLTGGMPGVTAECWFYSGRCWGDKVAES